MRFIHTADIHLDSLLKGLAAYPDAPAHLLRSATRDAFDNLITEAVTELVDFMVIAGDLYDGSWKDFNTGIHFAGQMGRLHAAGIPVYLLLGNHDAESEMTRKLVLPPNVHLFPSAKAATYSPGEEAQRAPVAAGHRGHPGQPPSAPNSPCALQRRAAAGADDEGRRAVPQRTY